MDVFDTKRRRFWRHPFPAPAAPRTRSASLSQSRALTDPTLLADEPLLGKLHDFLADLSTKTIQSLAFQSVLATAMHTVNEALLAELQLTRAAVSLAQAERLGAMVSTLQGAQHALDTTLTAQGRHIVQPFTAKLPKADSWWFALAEALHILEQGVERTRALVGGQERGSESRTLSSLIARLLRDHHQTLQHEAEQWLGG
ncbi:MAG: hypothetical protein RhofKO_30220 [Rhodothermales bacterium]